jgi:hypothetical protein
MPEWYVISFILGILSLMGFLWKPLFLALPLLLFTGGASLIQAGLRAARAIRNDHSHAKRYRRFSSFALTTYLHLIHPLARLLGRTKCGLTPLRQQHRPGDFTFPRRRKWSLWAEHGLTTEQWLRKIEASLKTEGAAVFRGGEYDSWDLELRGGVLGTSRLLLGVEEHGGGKQLLRIRVWPRCFPWGIVTIVLCALFSASAGIHDARLTASLFGSVMILLSLRAFKECAATMAILKRVLKQQPGSTASEPLSKNSEVISLQGEG